MPPVLLMFASRYWKASVLVLGLSAALVYRAVLVHERDAARRVAAELRLNVSELQAANGRLAGALTRQDAAVGALKKAADDAARALSAQSAIAAQAGVRDAMRAEGQARALSHATVDPGCAAAIRWGNARAAELSRW